MRKKRGKKVNQFYEKRECGGSKRGSVVNKYLHKVFFVIKVRSVKVGGPGRGRRLCCRDSGKLRVIPRAEIGIVIGSGDRG